MGPYGNLCFTQLIQQIVSVDVNVSYKRMFEIPQWKTTQCTVHVLITFVNILQCYLQIIYIGKVHSSVDIHVEMAINKMSYKTKFGGTDAERKNYYWQWPCIWICKLACSQSVPIVHVSLMQLKPVVRVTISYNFCRIAVRIDTSIFNSSVNNSHYSPQPTSACVMFLI